MVHRRVSPPPSAPVALLAVSSPTAECRLRPLTLENNRDSDLEAAILELLAGRAGGASICPSEAARAVAEGEDTWKELMEPARRAARRLVAAGEVEITQKGRVVDPSTAKGPIRVRRR